MNAHAVPTFWGFLEKTLIELSFTNNDIEMVKTDLENLINAQVITELLEQLPSEKQITLKDKITTLTNGQKTEFLKNEIKNTFTDTEVQELVFSATKDVLREYFQYLLSKVDSSLRNKILQQLTQLQ